ncbi:FMN-binding glutamate synthase family protein [Streptomyces sp. TX20-6-3]|uniref:FMN-binding glutamate synthase family protein n=1 Tax=Streptomyces sp. TX20-6-3 TaxID=3028705 RepID=UPI0029B83998|nr:FMN-binding glutamate synthase family protein [Streptomyces sp. TX20-6-3]MDX2561960.1 FMN-binding glutamate synthase family protein [Streptomyces sp. TX20-6-3]
MLTLLLVVLPVVAALATGLLAVLSSPWWWCAAGPALLLAAVASYDIVQRRHSILRNYPLLGHLRFAMEKIRPEVQQYFVERNVDGSPFDRDTRSIVYERAKGTDAEDPFGTELELYRPGTDYLVPSMAPRPVSQEPPRVRIGGPDCTRPYGMALLNVSAMSFGSLSGRAVRALNEGARRGGFAHDTGEGGISDHHLAAGGDLVWEIGTGYFGCRTEDGDFDPRKFAEKAAFDQVACVLLKISQGAKPGIGGVLPGSKVSREIATTRGVPVGRTVISPPYHRVYRTPRELVRFVGRMRELAGGKPVGFKLCVGSRREFLAVCKAMLEEDVTPDFIVVDGAEGGTGAAPLEFADTVGLPLTQGLTTVHRSLVGAGLRDRIRIGASGKIATGGDIVKRLIQGADYTNSARAMMFALGCVQAQRCHTNTCPVGVATQDPRRARALDVADKARRVQRFQEATVKSALQIMAAMGVDEPGGLAPGMLLRRVGPDTVRSHADLYVPLEAGQLLSSASVPPSWAGDWNAAHPDRFTLR